MKREEPMEEIPRWRKPSQTASRSKSNRRASHKHQYEPVIFWDFLGFRWSGRCRLCGKFQSTYRQFSTARRADFMTLETQTARRGGKNYLGLEEIERKFPGVPVYRQEGEEYQQVL